VFLIEGEDSPTVTMSGVPGVRLDGTILDIAMTGGVKVGGAMTRMRVATIIVVIGPGSRRASGTVDSHAAYDDWCDSERNKIEASRTMASASK